MKLKGFLLVTASGIFAGFMVGIGGTVYLAAPSQIIGGVLFSVGLLTICTYGMRLFTGSIGYLLTDSTTPRLYRLLTGCAVWLGNLVGTGTVGLCIRFVRPDISEKAAAISQGKLGAGLVSTFLLAIFCGLLMYLAVDIYRTRTGFYQISGILIAVPVFIVAGFEHSIANMYYLAAAYGFAMLSVRVFVFLAVVTLGNAVGSVILPLARRLKEMEKD